MKRLSDSVIRGFGKLTPHEGEFITWQWNNHTGIPCGCALGAALLDCISLEEARSQTLIYHNRAPTPTGLTPPRDSYFWTRIAIIPALQQHFPWFTDWHEHLISGWFREYVYKSISFAILIDRIRDLEEPYLTQDSPETTLKEQHEYQSV